MKNYVAVLGFIDRYTGTDYETIYFEARNVREAEKIAIEKCDSFLYRYSPDSFFVDSVREVH